uniref:Single-stranded DNA binding protein n=1 Tax=Hypnea pannosa TaxID=105607 RepID=A0A4D6WTW5_9FLOR|nr:hypothetical protein [Hypnea pannosa]
MNLFISTGKIISNPRLYRIKQKVFLKINIVFFKRKKKVHLFSIVCFVKGNLAIHLFDMLKKNDVVFIEGYIKIKPQKSYNNKKNMKIANIQIKRLSHWKKIIDRLV